LGKAYTYLRAQRQRRAMADGSKKDLGLVSINAAFKTKRIGPLLVSSYTHIGKRNNQEDRFVVAPSLQNGEYAFFGVFDGTVREFAADFVSKTILESLLAAPSFRTFDALTPEQKAAASTTKLLRDTLSECFLLTDERLLTWCRENENHYSSTTAVTAFVHIPTRRLLVAHIGDSKVVLGRTEHKEGEDPQMLGVSVTTDHKPNMPEERKRIEAAGGSLTYLHGGKPFIRGGDFTQRKHAMQLNYSRAFGGKDLKMYGLSAVPDISEFVLDKRERVVVLGSDGLWDVVDPTSAVQLAEQAAAQQKCPSEELTLLALKNHVAKGSADNVTAICCFFEFSEQT